MCYILTISLLNCTQVKIYSSVSKMRLRALCQLSHAWIGTSGHGTLCSACYMLGITGLKSSESKVCRKLPLSIIFFQLRAIQYPPTAQWRQIFQELLQAASFGTYISICKFYASKQPFSHAVYTSKYHSNMCSMCMLCPTDKLVLQSGVRPTK